MILELELAWHRYCVDKRCSRDSYD